MNRASITQKMRAIVVAPPWYVRILGLLIVAADVAWWLGDKTPSGPLDLGKHGIILLVGLSMCYPEGAIGLMSFARRILPTFGRRDG